MGMKEMDGWVKRDGWNGDERDGWMGGKDGWNRDK